MDDSSCEAQEQHTHQYYRRLNESLKVKAACIIAHAQSALQDQVDESVVDCGSISSSDEGHSSTDGNVLFIEQKHKAQCEERDYQPTPVSVLCDSDSPLTETDSGIAGAIGSADVKTQVAFYRTSFLAASKEQERLKNELTVLHKEKAELTNKLKCYHDNSINLRSCTDNQSSRIDNLSRALESSRLECAQGRSKVVQLEKLCATNERKVQCSCKVQSQQQVRLDRAQQQVTKLAAQVQELERKLIEQRREFNECTKRLEADKQRLHRHNQQLVVGFKTQMRLIDVLKKQKLHLQAAKLLQISEAEFLKTIGSDLESS